MSIARNWLFIVRLYIIEVFVVNIFIILTDSYVEVMFLQHVIMILWIIYRFYNLTLCIA